MSVEGLLDTVAAAPKGDSVVAFFDMDGTVLAGFTAFVFAQERLKRPSKEHIDLAAIALRYQLGRATFTELITASAMAMKGESTEDAQALSSKLFASTIAGLIYPEARTLISAHKAQGHKVVLLSAATDLQVGRVAQELDVDAVLCNRLMVDAHNTLTGELAQPIIFGEGKSAAATAFAHNNQLDLANAFFYTDGVEDLPLLDEVGYPQPLNPDKRLTRASKDRGWSTPKFTSRGRPKPTQVIRTILAQTSVFPSVAAGLAAGFVNGDRRQGLNLALSTWGDFSVALAGVKVDLRNEENLWSHRPCVFLFNHQSNFDGLLMMKLLRRDVTAVAKKEVQHLPVVGAVFTFGEMIFIDRDDHAGAIKALSDAADTVRSGLSVAIAPEGTRQTTPRLGQFKKGGFHLAMAAGVRVVPIVIHNSLDVLPKGTKILRPATVRVDVLDPVDTSGWKTSTIGRHVDQVRDLYLEALGQKVAKPRKKMSS